MNTQEASILRWMVAPAMAGALFCTGCSHGSVEGDSGHRRSFHMGFTPFIFDNRPGASERAYDLLNPNSDMIALHMDFGVPWPEALANLPYSDAVEREIALRKKHMRPGQKVYLALNALNLKRNNMAAYWGGDWGEDWNETVDQMLRCERPGKWNDKSFDDPEAIEAYLNHCRRMIREFQPDYLAYGVEVNFLPMSNPAALPAYLRFNRQVYSVLKGEYPNLPLFLTFYIDHFREQREGAEPILRELLQYSDYVAVSSYPYLAGYSAETLPGDWFDAIAALAPEKPFCIAETGFIAKPMPPQERTPADPIAAALDRRIYRAGSEEMQAAYLDRILRDTQRLNGRFLAWFFVHDIDGFYRVAKDAETRDFLLTWRDSGLFDGQGNPRKGLDAWRNWLVKPFEPAK